MVLFSRSAFITALLLLPTQIRVLGDVNDSKPMLFGLDMGAFSKILSLRAGRQVAKVSSDYRDRVNGLSGEVNQLYGSAKATFSFGHFRQTNQGIVTFDLSGVSSQTGRRSPVFWDLKCSGNLK